MGSENGTFAHGRNRVTRDLLGGLRGGAVLDYGCGNARFAVAMASELGLDVYACDIDSKLIEELKQSHGPEVEFFAIPDSEPRLPIADRALLAVTCCDVLEHMPPDLRVAALLEMRRVLADDGALIVTTPHKGLLSFADPENFKFHFPKLHRYLFTFFKGRQKYMERYGGGERYGNFSAGAERHVHFSTAELSQILETTGFRVERVRYFTLIYPFIRMVLWMTESLAKRVAALEPLSTLCWHVYRWDSDVEPGKLACSIAIRATRATAPARPDVTSAP